MLIRLKNFKQRKSYEIELPDRGLVLLSGPSGAGKSTIMDAIFEAVTGEADDILSRSGENRLRLRSRASLGCQFIERARPPLCESTTRCGEMPPKPRSTKFLVTELRNFWRPATCVKRGPALY